ncbi:LPS export ABC transporter permease LptF [Motilimonas pumila]|uniref:Lipopolysaccharide export system permease protein LptF n=1 Tax=Motilimonas pumila TaxID=2303987 RepID=A0A418YKN8_9GAMM|nr:LPS export ABC transporter permease LptF [Motilimonas pumila]RJG51526.1 LPS export ABC transporter permease LptF [Motilimonas pumila]
MILFRYIFKETFKTQMGVLFVLLLIFVSQKFVRVLADAVSGNIPHDLVFTILWLNLPSLATLMIPISLFIGVLFAHGRLHAESEIVVMTACGYSPRRILNATMALAICTAIAAGFNTFYISPMANEKERKVFEEAEADAGLATLIEGQFHSLPDNAGVVYVEKYEKGFRLKNLFAAHWPNSPDRRPSTITAKSGRVTEENGAKILTLYDGYRYEGESGRKDYQVTQFESFSLILENKDVKEARRKVDTIPTLELIGSDDLSHQTELQWRMALPISILVLTIVVVPMASVNPRQGRYAKLLPALLLYLSFFLLLSASRSGIEDGSFPLFTMWSIQAIFLTFGVYLNIKDSAKFNKQASKPSQSATGGAK